MKCISVVCVLSAFLAISLAAPAPIDESNIVPVHNQVKRQTDNTATLNRIITYSNNKIQMLRKLFPQVFQVIDNVIQNVTSQVFRVVGGALLRSGGLGGTSSTGGGGGGRVSVVLPTFPPDEDEDDDDDDDDEDDEILNIQNSINATASANLQANPLNLRLDLNEIDANANLVSSENDTTAADNTTSASTTVVNLEAFMTSPSASETRSARKVREANDQETAASGGIAPNPGDLSDVDAEESDRNKRFLPFGGDGQGSAGGSGNFLFDLIRLVAGSGTTEETDEKTAGVGGVAEIDVSPKGNGEGIPGPITRLLVIANRGIANLIQDLILRLAQTSERIVNFKARLVTALI